MLANIFFDKYVKKNDDARLATQADPDGIVETNDIPYLDDGHKLHMLDIYRPEGATGKMPFIVDIHGGAWVYGDKELNRKYCLHLAKEGFAVVNLSFRLIPEVDFAGSMKDILAALEFVKKNADKFDLDLNNAFITGDSAGGHSAAMVLASGGNKTLQDAFGGKNPIDFKAVCFTCAAFNPSDFAKIPLAGAVLFNGMYGRFYRGKKKRALYESYDFSNVIPDDMCPTVLITAYADFLRKQSHRLKSELDAKGVETLLIDFDEPMSDGYKLEHVYNSSFPDRTASVLANQKTCAFFKSKIN